MAWYKTGTVAVTNASTTVTGTGTNFVSGAQVGDGFLGPNELLYEITAINSATSLTIAPAYGGATASSQSYAIAPTQGLVATLASDVTDLITDYQSVVDNVGAGKFGDGSAASPAIRFTNDQDTGFFRDTANEIAFATAGVKRGEFSSSGIQMLDGQKFIAGTGSDLSIFHNGSASIIEDSGTGGITLRSNLLTVQNAAGNETVAQFVEDGFVKLFHNNSQVFTTVSTGIDVTGTLTADGLTVETDNASIVFTGTTGNNFITAKQGLRIDIDSDNNQGATSFGVTRDGGLGNLLNANENGDVTLYASDGATAKFFWDASAESLGIGNAAPATALDVTGTVTVDGDAAFSSQGSSITFNSGNASSSKIGAYDFSGSSPVNPRAYMEFLGVGADQATDIVFYTDNSATTVAERMRIDSSGNLLVGKTSADGGATTGLQAAQNGNTYITRASSTANVNTVLTLNRLTSDGDILRFLKDGTTVGSIGTGSGRIAVGNGNTFVTFAGDLNALYPASSSSTTPRDNAIDIGTSGTRFQDLYLSGGVYLGGTGAANKLDDYESGFFEPTFTSSGTNPSGITYDPTIGNEGHYTKIGRVVHIQINIRTDAISDKGTGNLYISGLPFASAGYSGHGGYSVFTCQADGYLSDQPSAAQIGENSTVLGILYRTVINGGLFSSQTSSLNTGSNDNLTRISGTYMTEE